ncbi:MAG: hypothetical protein IIA60_04340 [Candidatus Marinimicrobia bacterium]|nr:hypothetical protein [Candidatus Neomarinimicrobiota bacterium]
MGLYIEVGRQNDLMEYDYCRVIPLTRLFGYQIKAVIPEPDATAGRYSIFLLSISCFNIIYSKERK